MKFKKTLLMVLSIVALTSCNRTAQTDSSNSSKEDGSSSKPAEKSNYLTEQMLSEISSGYSVDETVTTKIELKAGEFNGQPWDAQNAITTNVQYVESTDKVYHITQGNTINDTKIDPVDPDAPENIANESYYVPKEKDGQNIVAFAQLNLANEAEYQDVVEEIASDTDDDTEVADDDTSSYKYLLWDDNFKPFFSKMTVDDFEKEKEEKRSFTFSIDSTDTNEELLAKGNLISMQLIGMPGIKLESLNIRTDGYHISEFSATFQPYSFVYEDLMNVDLVYSIEGRFTAVGSDKITPFGPDTSDSIATFENRMKAFETPNFACLEEQFQAADNDGAYSSKASVSVNVSTNGSRYYYWQTPSKADSPYLREGAFQIDDNHYIQGIELYNDNAGTSKSWYYSSPKITGKISDVLPSFNISSKLFEPLEDEEDTYRLKDKYLTTLKFDSSAFDMFVHASSSVTTTAGTFPLTDFKIDFHLEDKIIFTYTYDCLKVVVTYSGFGQQETETAAPAMSYLPLSSSETVEMLKTEQGEKTLTSIKADFGTEDEGLIDEVFKNLPLIPGNEGFAQGTLKISENKTRFFFGYLVTVASTDEGTQSNILQALSPLMSFFIEGFGYEQHTVAEADKMAAIDTLFTKIITYNGKKYQINAHLIVSSVYSGDSLQGFLVGYTVNITEVND